MIEIIKADCKNLEKEGENLNNIEMEQHNNNNNNINSNASPVSISRVGTKKNTEDIHKQINNDKSVKIDDTNSNKHSENNEDGDISICIEDLSPTNYQRIVIYKKPTFQNNSNRHQFNLHLIMELDSNGVLVTVDLQVVNNKTGSYIE